MMSKTNTENDKLLSPNQDNFENVPNRTHLMSSTRKNWSLTDRKTDQEVLQEMGIGLLQTDEEDACKDEVPPSPIKPNLKRKRDIENVNPNKILSATSPRSPFSPKSPKLMRCSPTPGPSKVKSPRRCSPTPGPSKVKSPRRCSPTPGPSKVKSPRSSEKSKPLQSLENQLETTLQDEYLLLQEEEETPLGQSVSAHYLPTRFQNTSGRRLGLTPLGQEEEAIISKMHKSYPVGNDSFSELSDEMMLSIFKWLPKRTLAHCMLVCKRWNRVACDETLWQRLDLGNKLLAKDALGRIIDRKPVVVRLATSEIGEWNPKTEPAQSRIQFLDLSMCTIDTSTLQQLLRRCSALRKLSLEGLQLNDEICEILGDCSNLETLNLTMAQGITEAGLKSMLEGCSSLQALNISWCNLSEAALEVLVTCLPPRLQRVNVGGARIMTDEMVSQLVERCPRLLELDLSDCSRLCAGSIDSILTLSRCEHLALSRCYLLPPHALTKLSSMPSLQYLEVWGMLQTASLTVLKSSLPAIQVNQFMFSAIARPTVGTRRTSIWGLRTRD